MTVQADYGLDFAITNAFTSCRFQVARYVLTHLLQGTPTRHSWASLS